MKVNSFNELAHRKGFKAKDMQAAKQKAAVLAAARKRAAEMVDSEKQNAQQDEERLRLLAAQKEIEALRAATATQQRVQAKAQPANAPHYQQRRAAAAEKVASVRKRDATKRRIKPGKRLVSVKRPQNLREVDDAANQIARMEDPTVISPGRLDELKIVHPGMSDRKRLDLFRRLRTQIFEVTGRSSFTLMVSSVIPNGGASFVAANLAASIAFDESKTSLLVDCNLLDPYHHLLLDEAGIDYHYGLTDYLEDPTLGMENIIRPSGISRMRLIPAGHNRLAKAEYFASIGMRQFMSEVKSRYTDRFILVDGPSVEDSADARIMADLCDYVLLVVPYGQVLESQVLSAVDALDEKKLVGVVLNNEPTLEF